MAMFYKCDTCDAISPNKNGLYIANHWTKISALNNIDKMHRKVPREYLICTDCMRTGVRISDEGVTA